MTDPRAFTTEPAAPMDVVVFGASGMVGHGVLHACLEDPGVARVFAVGRRPLGVSHPRLTEIVHQDFADLSPVADRLTGVSACFYCLGVSAAGHTEAAYTRVTHDFTLEAARTLLAANPGLTFTYVSGEGTDSTERGRTMWARVKGRTENALLALPMDAWMFRPGYIRPRRGAVSRTRAYRVVYGLTSWLYPLLHRLAPGHTTTTDHLGRAMLAVARHPGQADRSERVLYSRDINRLGAP
ncbi:epimerase [Streptomyces sp. NPDC058417]|uniref:epimerase n=1 Tax=unclassified Streptomyces TaxID=2593676 RepID=UPI00364CDEF1